MDPETFNRPASLKVVAIAEKHGAEWFAEWALRPCLEHVPGRVERFTESVPEPLRTEVRERVAAMGGEQG